MMSHFRPLTGALSERKWDALASKWDMQGQRLTG